MFNLEFTDQIRAFVTRVNKLKGKVETEEATKTSLIMPFFSLLGYDIFNPLEFIPEYTADVGIKKGEKVDYAIMNDEKPIILIEAKSVKENLDKYSSQLFRYFGTTEAKFTILTNGIEYRFYTDLDEPNKMDPLPFFTINLLDLREQDISELKKFQKTTFDIDKVFNTAEDLKYTNQIKQFFAKQLEEPENDFVGFVVGATYSGRRTQSVIDKFKPIVKKSLTQFIGDLVNDRIKAALNQSPVESTENNSAPVEEVAIESVNKIHTLQEELEAFAVVKVLLKDVVPLDKITYKDTESYFGILYENNSWKWICRLKIETSKKSMFLPGDNKQVLKFPIESINDIFNYSEQIKAAAKKIIEPQKQDD